MSGPLDRVLEALRAHGCDPKPCGDNWSAKCPAHDDRSPSLSVGEGEDARALLTCHAGCETKAIVAALGMRMHDLFPLPPSSPGARGRQTVTIPPAAPSEAPTRSYARPPELTRERGIAHTGTSLDAASDLVRRGYSVIPVPPKSKNPGRKGWPEERITEAELPKRFKGEKNIGILNGVPPDHRIDVDLDDPVAVMLAPEYLPPTGAIFGRESKPRSHWAYPLTGPLKTAQLKRSPTPEEIEAKQHAGVPEKKAQEPIMVAEIRSTGSQSIAPGSVHPLGEPVEWYEDGEPAEVDPEALTRAVAALAERVRREYGVAEIPSGNAGEVRVGAGVEITCSPHEKAGYVLLLARFPAGDPFTHVLNVVNATSRKKCVEMICEGRDGLDRSAIAAHLDRAAAEVAAEPGKAGPPANVAGQREKLLAGADERTAAALDEMDPEVRRSAEAMLADPALLEIVLRDIEEMGVVGERPLAATSYLIGTSRLMRKPLAAIVQGGTSTGKTFVPLQASHLFPEEAKWIATDLTTNSLFYMEPGGLMHKLIVAGERRRGADEDNANATRALREMIETGELSKLVPMKIGNIMRTVHLRQPAPIAYVESTTKVDLFDEDANRCFLLGTDESADQTARIVAAQGRRAEETPPDNQPILDRHHALQRLLKRVDVRIPFAVKIAKAIPTQRQEARRAMPQILNMIGTVALLHQRQRAARTPENGDSIDAAIVDYVIARRLLLGPLGRGLGGGLPSAVAGFAGRLRDNFAQEVFTSVQAMQRDGVLHARSKVNEYLGALQQVGVTECVEPSRGPKPALWKVVGEVPEGGALWLPTVNAQGEFE